VFPVYDTLDYASTRYFIVKIRMIRLFIHGFPPVRERRKAQGTVKPAGPKKPEIGAYQKGRHTP